ncbi:MAG: hypothetical protein AABY93_04400 [Bacteroidota bacterium]
MERAVLVENLQKKIASIKQKDLLEELQGMVDEMLIADKDSDFWNELTEFQKKNIEVSLKQIETGHVTDHEIVMQKAKTWLKK